MVRLVVPADFAIVTYGVTVDDGMLVVCVATIAPLIRNCTDDDPLALTQKVWYVPSAIAAIPVSVVVPTEAL